EFCSILLPFLPQLLSKSLQLLITHLLSESGFPIDFVRRLQKVGLCNYPEINPLWYVGHGVRPIGRFGKRQFKFGQKRLRPDTSYSCKQDDLLGTDSIYIQTLQK
uniref:Uncharacterized protein n=1 Tax=Pseudonaja textilis TaxID=8673 RepID=A0A670ZFG8_PSETE